MTTRPYSTSVLVLVLLLSILSVTGTVEECPPWFILESSDSSLFPQCVCSDTLDFEVIICDQRRSFLQLGYCAFQDSTTNATVVAGCPYVFPDHLIVDGHISLPNKSSELNQFVCGNLNRDIGTPLCGRCANGTGPSIYSLGSQCVRCSAVNIVYYLLLQYLPTTILCVAIIVFRFNVTSAPMAHYVLYCEILALVFKFWAGQFANFHHTTTYTLTSILLTLNGIWTLDFFYFVSPPLCVSEHMEEIYIPFLDMVATYYPFILLLLTYVGIELHAHDFKPVVHLWTLVHRPFVRFRKTWDPNASVIHAFATLFFLSYAKFIVLMYEALFISVVTNEKDEVVSRVSYSDPTVSIFSHKHWYLISLSMFILVFIIIPPLLLLLVFPTCVFRKASRHLKPRWIISIQTFVDPFYSCYKDGTNGTRDWRAVSGYILVLFALLPVVVIATRVLTTSFLIHTTLIIVFNTLTIACALLRPYKYRTANISGVTLPAICSSVTALLILSVVNVHRTITIVSICAFLLCLPHCVFYGYIVYRFGKLLKQYCCKTREMEDSVDERLPCRPADTTGYSHLSEVSSCIGVQQ